MSYSSSLQHLLTCFSRAVVSSSSDFLRDVLLDGDLLGDVLLEGDLTGDDLSLSTSSIISITVTI